MTKEIDRFFNSEIKRVDLESRARAAIAARELERDVKRQIRRNFNNPSLAFQRGVKVYDFEDGSYVRLSPILSVHAEPTKIQGSPNLWILLPDGMRLGFKRIGKGFNYNDLKRRHGTRIRFVNVSDGSVVLFRASDGKVYPIYKIQSSVTTTQRIEFYERAEEIAERMGTNQTRTGRQVDFKDKR